jgi:hypothetical protein
MLSVDKINPLNVLSAREVSDPPPHFHYLYVDLRYNIINSIKQWIYENLRNRFYLGECLQLVDNQFSVRIKIGFEEPKDASFFLLACPHLKYLNQ